MHKIPRSTNHILRSSNDLLSRFVASSFHKMSTQNRVDQVADRRNLVDLPLPCHYRLRNRRSSRCFSLNRVRRSVLSPRSPVSRLPVTGQVLLGERKTVAKWRRGGGVEKWRERTKEKGTLDSFGARNLAQLENEWHFNPRPRTRGQATRWKRRRHRCLHCKMIQRRRTKKQKERNTEGIGSECWKRARGTGDGSKDSVQVVKGRTETERVGERANTSVACLFKHVPVPWFLFQPLAPTHPPPPFRSLRVERASTRDQVESDTPASLHNTYTAHRELLWTYAKPVRIFLALWYVGDQPAQKSDTAVRFGAGESATSGRSFVRNSRGKRGLE